MKETKYFSLPMEIIERDAYAFDDSLIPVDIKVMHSGLNLNNSTFSDDSIEKAKNSLKNKPILGYIQKGDGEDSKDFAGHEVEMAITNDGVKYTYLERPLGVIPEMNNYSILEEDDKNFVFCRGYLWKEYLNDGYEILQESPNKSVSMEIAVDDYSINDDGSVDITDYRYLGITILGDDMPPAMSGAEMNVVGLFSSDNKDLYSKIETLNKEIATHFASKEQAVEGGEKMGIDNKDAVEIAKGADGVTPADVKSDADATTDVDAEGTKVQDVNAEEPGVEKPVEAGLEEADKTEKTLGKSEEEKEEIRKERGFADEDEEDEEGVGDDSDALQKAKDAVAKAEETKSQTDIDKAQELINELEDGEDKDSLQSRLDAVKEDADADEGDEEGEEDYEAKFTSLSEKYNKLEEEVVALREFKQKAEDHAEALKVEAERQKKIDYINENYPNIDEEVKQQFVDKVDSYDNVEAIDADICVYIVKNQVQFSQASKKDSSVKIAIDEEQISKTKGSPYGNLFKK